MRTQAYSFDGNGQLVRTTVEVIQTCENGHDYTPETVRLRKGGERQPLRLVCAICERQRSRDHKRRRAAREAVSPLSETAA